MKHYPDFTPDMARHFHLTDAVIFYAYWLSADLDSYIEQITDEDDHEAISDSKIKVIDERYNLILKMFDTATNLFDKRHMEAEGFSNQSIDFLENSIEYNRALIKKSDPARTFKILRNDDLDETDTQLKLLSELEFIEKIAEIGNELHPDFYLTNAIYKFEQLLSLMSEDISEINGSQFFATRYSKLSGEFHLSKASFLSFGKGSTCANEIRKIADSIFDEASKKNNYLNWAATLFGSWENLFQLGEKLIKQFANPVDDEDIEEIHEEFQKVYRYILLAELRYYESVMQSAKKFSVKNMPLVQSGLPSTNLSNCISTWQEAFNVQQTG